MQESKNSIFHNLNYVPFVWYALSENRLKCHSLVTFAGRYIYPRNHGHTEHNRICSQQIDATVKRYVIQLLLLLLAAECAVFSPVFFYLTQGIRSTTVEVKIPLVEDNKDVEYSVNMLLQLIIFFHGSFLYFGMEIALVIFRDVVSVSPLLIKNRLSELTELYERKELSELQLRFAFLDVIKQMQDYERFVSCVRDFLYWRTFVTPLLFTYSIAMSIFCQYSVDFKAGYGISVMSWVQFFYMCETGQSIEDNGLDDILYDINWYILPCKMQKHLMLLIQQRQNRITLNVGPFGVVNRDRLKLVTNKIYSFVMFLLNFTS